MGNAVMPKGLGFHFSVFGGGMMGGILYWVCGDITITYNYLYQNIAIYENPKIMGYMWYYPWHAERLIGDVYRNLQTEKWWEAYDQYFIYNPQYGWWGKGDERDPLMSLWDIPVTYCQNKYITDWWYPPLSFSWQLFIVSLQLLQLCLIVAFMQQFHHCRIPKLDRKKWGIWHNLTQFHYVLIIPIHIYD